MSVQGPKEPGKDLFEVAKNVSQSNVKGNKWLGKKAIAYKEDKGFYEKKLNIIQKIFHKLGRIKQTNIDNFSDKVLESIREHGVENLLKPENKSLYDLAVSKLGISEEYIKEQAEKAQGTDKAQGQVTEELQEEPETSSLIKEDQASEKTQNLASEDLESEYENFDNKLKYEANTAIFDSKLKNHFQNSESRGIELLMKEARSFINNEAEKFSSTKLHLVQTFTTELQSVLSSPKETNKDLLKTLIEEGEYLLTVAKLADVDENTTEPLTKELGKLDELVNQTVIKYQSGSRG